MLSFYCTLIDAEEDKIAFEHIYNTYRKRMFYIANTILKNKEDAEDAVQNALLGIAKTMETVPTENEDELRAYVYKEMGCFSMPKGIPSKRYIGHFKKELIEYIDYYSNRRIKARLKGMPPTLHR